MFTLLEDECHTLDLMLASRDMSVINETCTPIPFQEYRSKLEQKTSLLNDRVTAENEVMAAEQFITLLSVLGESPQIKSLEEIALYNRRLIAEIVSLTCRYYSNLYEINAKL